MAVLSLKICLSALFVLCMINVVACGKGSKGTKIQEKVAELEKTLAELRNQCCGGKLNLDYIKCVVNGEVFEDSCYLIFPPTMWKSAVDDCSAMGAHLVEVNNKEESEFLKIFLYKNDRLYSWLGATDTWREGVWRWLTTNEEITFKIWNNGEPNGGTHENCLMMNRDPFWNDLNCIRNLPYVCEFSN